MFGHRHRNALIAILWIVGGTSTALAQLQTGAIRGTVIDQTDEFLPAVTVLLTSPTAVTRTTQTSQRGMFRFPNLAPGSYDLQLTLNGFSTVERTGLVVAVGQAVDLRLLMSLGAEAAIEVSGRAATLDRTRVGTATSRGKEELQSIPSARDPWAVLQSVPGVLVDRINVGGSESGQQATFIGKGTEFRNTMWHLDGVAITDMAATGFSSFYYDFDSFEEIQVSTAGSDIKQQTGGVGINLVTKRGGNELHSSARLLLTGDNLQSSNVPDHLDTIGFVGNRIDQIAERGIELSGPILRDRLWAWGALSRNDINQLTITGSSDETLLNNASLKVNSQLGDATQASLFWYRGAKEKFGRGASVTRTPDTAWDQTAEPPPTTYKAEVITNLGPNLYLSGRYSHLSMVFALTPAGGRDINAYRDPNGIWFQSFQHHEFGRPQDQLVIDGNYFGSWWNSNHDLQFGFNYRRTPVDSLSAWPSDGVVADERDGLAWITRNANSAAVQETFAAYVGDTVTMDRLTLKLGVRFDRQWGNPEASSSAANPLFPELLPALEVSAGDTPFTWSNVSPRLGVTYALGEDRSTLIRASYSKYADQLGIDRVTYATPGAGIAELQYLWTDANGDRTVQREEVDLDAGLQFFSNVDPDNPTATGTSFNKIDADLEAPTTHEFSFGLERQLNDRFVVGGNFTWRRMVNRLWMPLMLEDGSLAYRDNWVHDSTITEADLTGNTRDWYEREFGRPFSADIYRLADGLSFASSGGRLLTNRDGYHQSYKGIELYASKRLSDRWMMRASFAYNDWREHFTDPNVSITDPTSIENEPLIDGGRFANDLNGNWQFNLSGLYQLPHDMSVSASMFARQGFMERIHYRAGDPDGIAAKNLLLFPVDEVRLPNVFIADFRFEKKFRFSAHQLVFDVDLFNVFNNNAELDIQSRADQPISSADPSSPDTLNAFLREGEIIAPRVMRFGVRWLF